MAEESSSKEKDTITVSKDTFYGIVIAVLAGLLILSIFTQGFGIIKTTQPSQPTQPTQPMQPTQPSGGTGNIVSLMDDDMKLGSDSAPVVIVEFSDFQCPFCRKFFVDTYGQIKKDYIDAGKVQIVFRDFPLSFHPAAEKSAEAVECAADQNKGWEMHDKVFQEEEKQGQGTIQYGVSDLKTWASEIGLNMSTFNDCLDSGKQAQEIQKDISDGSTAGVQGTPSFMIGKRSGGKIVPISGAQPYNAFKSAIDQLLQ